MVNIDTRRPLRPLPEFEMMSSGKRQVFDQPPVRLTTPAHMELLHRRQVVYSDLDVVGHVNNVKYMEWCIDAVADASTAGREIREFQINYLSETLLGDEIVLYGVEQNPVVFSARRVRDDAEIFRARLSWE